MCALLALYSIAVAGHSLSCDDTRVVAEYHVRFEGMWTKSRFPKVYPENRPKAEWSSLIGEDAVLWQQN